MDAVISGVLPMRDPASIERHYTPNRIGMMSLPGSEGGGKRCRINQRSVAAARAKVGWFRGHRSGWAAADQRRRSLDGWRMMRRNKVPRQARSMTRRVAVLTRRKVKLLTDDG